ncbi:YeeE/YedE family protein [Methylobacterium sp. P5_C11]
MDGFTPLSAVLGGVMIGTAAALFLLLNGRIAGISGILGGLLALPPDGTGWRVAFLGGLVLAPLAYAGLGGSLPPVTVDAAFPLLAVAGLLVGFGARLGAGCTSGHGVCGIGRGSPRSLIATGTFMAVAMLTVFVTRHLVGA